MKLAILFWIYQEIDVCVNRAQLLRRENPDAPIYCLYGGPIADAGQFEQALAGLIDDFYVFDEDWDSRKKWLDGDLMIASWYRNRGALLDWDTIFIAQWDLVVLAPVRQICGSLQPGEILLPGLTPIAKVEHFWPWLRLGSEERGDYDHFKAELQKRHAFPDDPLCCNFVAAAFPREFLARYADEAPEFGFLEYKIPILAQIWGFGFCRDHQLKLTWLQTFRHPGLMQFWFTLHAEKYKIHPVVLAVHRALPWGRRVFHPYVRKLRM